MPTTAQSGIEYEVLGGYEAVCPKGHRWKVTAVRWETDDERKKRQRSE